MPTMEMPSLRSILVIDDDPQMLKVYQRILVYEGYRVVTAAGGKEALALCRSEAFDLVITDIFMDEMDGIELIVNLRRSYPGLKVLAVSGGGAMAEGGRFLNYAEKFGADKFDHQ